MGIEVLENASLKHRNTMGLAVTARYFCAVTSTGEVTEALAFVRRNNLRVWVLGGGSNVIFPAYLDAFVMSIDIKGIHYNVNQVTVSAGTGWHELVRDTLSHGRYGLENLSLIPGKVGAAPIQNIGAYGVELADSFLGLKAIEISTGKLQEFTNKACEFGYRDSVFKHEAKDKFLITEITFELSAVFTARLDYAELKERFQLVPELTAEKLSDAVIEIRSKKLPDPKKIGNVGSFFKNPIVSEDVLMAIQKQCASIVGIDHGKGRYKLSAAKLIDRLGLKGLCVGGASISDQHALVIVNSNNASRNDVVNLAQEIIDRVETRFGVKLTTEPEIIGDERL